MKCHFPNGLLYGLLAIGAISCQLACTHASSHAVSTWDKKEAVTANEQFNRNKIKTAKSLLKDGDLILRTGNDFISLALRQFSQVNKTYSHCGIVRKEHGKFFVYNAIGGENNPDAELNKESFEQFCNPIHNTGFGIFRYNLNHAQLLRMDSIVDFFYHEKIPFDMKFSLKSDSSFYCAEFVYRVLQKVTRQKDYIPTSHIGSFEYVAIDNLFLNPHTRDVYQAKFR